MSQKEEAYKRIWEGYKLYAGTAYVSRKGFELVGLTKDTETPLPVVEAFERRGESTMEHQAKTAWLAMAFNDNFPSFFSDLNSAYSLAYLMMTVGLCHDVGEVVIGDIPDDGNALHDTKDAAEREVFERLMAACPGNGKFFTKAFSEFQDKNVLRGKALYALDKVEAVLTLLFLEQYEHYGVMDKKPFVTESDRHFMRVTRTSCTTDCWAAHVKSLIQDFPETITGPVFGLLKVAVEDVRGEMFDWWDRDVLPEKD